MADSKKPAAAAAAGDGRSELFLGCMFAGKTSEMLRKIERARHGGLPCVLVKHAADDRFGAGPVVHAHDGTSIASGPATPDLGRLRVVEARALLDVELGPDELDVGVDEGQFYPDLPEALDLWMREGRRVYVAALDGDFRRKPFGRVLEAIPLANRVVKLTAICMFCPRDAGRVPADASYTVRIVEGDAQEMIGAKDKYKAACLACYLRVTGGQ